MPETFKLASSFMRAIPPFPSQIGLKLPIHKNWCLGGAGGKHPRSEAPASKIKDCAVDGFSNVK